MILSFPGVDHLGALTGGEISLCFSKIIAVQQMTRHEYNTETRTDNEVVVPDCVTICCDRHEFNIKHSYKEIVELLKQFNEIHE